MNRLGTIHVENDGRQFRRTNASVEQVIEAYRLLLSELPEPDCFAARNARAVMRLLGHDGDSL